MRRALTVLFTVLLATLCYCAPATQPGVVEFPADTKSVTIQGGSTIGMLCVPVRINDGDVEWLLVDTGCSGTILDAKFAEKLKLESVAPMSLNAIGGLMKGRLTKVDSMTLGDPAGQTIRVRPALVSVTDVSSITNTAGFRVVGFLGMDVIGAVPTTLDFRAMSMTFHRPDTFAPPPPPANRAPLVMDHYLPAIRCMVADKMPAWLTIDSGKTPLCNLDAPFYRLVSLDGKPTAINQSFSIGAGGVVKQWRGTFPSLEVFGQRLEKPRIDYSTTLAGDASLRRTAGKIGLPLLADRRLTLDPAGGQAWLEIPPRESTADLVARLTSAAPDRSGMTPLMFAVSIGRIDAAEALIKQGQPVNAVTAGNTSALNIASHQGDLPMVKFLLGHKANPNQATAVGGFFPLGDAAENGDPEMIRVLVAAGADLNQALTSGYTALHTAAEASHFDCVRELIAAKADVNKPTRNKITPIILAAQMGRKDIVLALLDAGADQKNPAWAIGMAGMCGNPEVIELLLARGADVNARLPDGATALMNAGGNGEEESVRVLLKHGADPTLKSKEGKTALDYAIEHATSDTGTLRLLIEAMPTTQPAK